MRKLKLASLMIVLVLLIANCVKNLEFERTLSQSKVGDIVRMGTYEQDGDKSNGKEPIEWRVLRVEQDRILLICEKGLENIQVEMTGPYVGKLDPDPHSPWECCSLRRMLNDGFLKNFTSDERRLMIASTIITEPNNGEGLGEMCMTKDMFFILSMEEAEKYFDDDFARRLSGTVQMKKSYGLEKGWWLRSPGYYYKHVAYVASDGRIVPQGLYYSNYMMLRPAVWITTGKWPIM